MRPRDRQEMLRLLSCMSETDHERTGILAKRAGLSMAAANRHLLAMPNCVEWIAKTIVTTSRHHSVPVYLWRRKPGAIEKVRQARVA